MTMKPTIAAGLAIVASLLISGCGEDQKPAAQQASSHVEIYTNPAADQVAQSSIYSVTVNEQDLMLFESRPPKERRCKREGCDGADAARKANRTQAWGNFSFEGKATVKVVKEVAAGEVKDIIIRPKRGAGVDYKVVSKDLKNRTVTLDVFKTNAKLSVEFVDDRYIEYREIPFDSLLIFADQLESKDHAKVPAADAKETYLVKNGEAFSREKAAKAKTVYFDAGVHPIGYWEVPESVMHVYLAGGSYVKGAINSALEHKRFQKGFTVSGRGVLSGEDFPWRPDKRKQGKDSCWRNGEAFDCWFQGVKMLQMGTDKYVFEGITIANAPHYVVTGFRDDNIAWNAHTPEGEDDPANDPLGEGLFTEEDDYSGIMSNFKVLGNWRWNGDGTAILRNSLVKDCFISPFDDAFKTYSDGGTVKDCVIWQTDNGAVFQFGWYPKNMSGLHIENLDLIHAEWTGRNQNWGIFNFADRGGNRGPTDRMFWMENSVFKNIYAEGPVTRVIALENAVVKQQGFRNLTFENIQLEYLVGEDKIEWLTTQGNGTINMTRKDWFGYPVGRPANIVKDYSGQGNISNILVKDLVIGGTKVTAENATTFGQFTLGGSDTMIRFE